MALQEFCRICGNSADTSSVFLGKLLHEHFCQRKDLVSPFTKGREVELKRIDPIIKILTELSVCDHLLQVLVCCAYEPDVHRYGLVVSDSCDASVLKGTQQLCLQMGRNVSDLI